MTKKSFLRALARIIIIFVMGMLATYMPTNIGEFMFGLLGVVLIDIYGILIEKGKL